MKITVLGCGALGQLWLAALYKRGHNVQGWLRVPQTSCSVRLIDKDGILFKKSFTANSYDFLARSSFLLVTLKAWQVSRAVKTLATVLPHVSPIILLHNGIGTLDELQDIVQPLIVGITTHAIKRNNDAIIHVTNGTTHIGPAKKLKGDYSHLVNTLNDALPDVLWHEIIKLQLWRKLAVNCVINPLTALWNCQNGMLRNHLQEVKILCTEIALVVKHEGLNISKEDLYNYVGQIIVSTAENTSSMLEDIRASRHTEIDYITGYLLKRAHVHGVSVPKNARLYKLIKYKEYENMNMNTNTLSTL